MVKNLISVVVPVFNMGQYISRSIESLLNQRVSNFELILVDDGSTDDSPLICDKLAFDNKKIRVIHKKNGGLSSARNCGIDNASGEYIIFPDPDDWVDENYLLSFINQQSNDIDLEICGNYIVTQNKSTVQNTGAKKEILNRNDAILSLLVQSKYCGFAWNKMYHMDIIKKYNLKFDEELGMAQDLHFAFRYILHCYKVSYDPTPHYFYYQHEGGVTNINHPLSSRKISGLKTYDKLFELAKEFVPEAIPIIGATIANQNLSFIYIYLNSNMDNPKLLFRLRANFNEYKGYFFKNNRYSLSHRILGLIALINPRIFYNLKRLRYSIVYHSK